MKKIFLIALALVLICGVAFAQDDIWGEGDEEDIWGDDSDYDEYAPEQKLIYFGAGAGLMYIQPLNDTPNFLEFLLYFRAGFHGDLLFSLGMFELGAEIGLYAMPLEDEYSGEIAYLALEIPLNAIVRINFSEDRSFAIEVVGGGWFRTDFGSGIIDEAFLFNAGARLCISYFYIGGNFLFGEYNAWDVELGGKIYF